jgi:uncharacterized RDD family membrane protein YckC
VYDSFLLFGLLMLFGYTAIGLESWMFGAGYVEKSPTAGGNPLVFVGMLVVICAFYCVFWLRNKQTLGMQAWRLQIETVDGSPLTIQHCIKRWLAGVLSFSLRGRRIFMVFAAGSQYMARQLVWHAHCGA